MNTTAPNSTAMLRRNARVAVALSPEARDRCNHGVEMKAIERRQSQHQADTANLRPNNSA